MNDFINLVDMVPKTIRSLRKLYENSTETLRNCGHSIDYAAVGMRVGTFTRKAYVKTFDTMKVPGHPWPAILAGRRAGGRGAGHGLPKGTPHMDPQRNREWPVGAKWAPEGTVLYENSTKTLRTG